MGAVLFHLVSSPWAWAPLLTATLASLVAAGFGCRKVPGLRTVRGGFFEGPGLTNSGAVSTILSMVPLLLSSDVRKDATSASLLGAATLLFAVSTFLGLWLYASVAAAPHSKDGDTVMVTIPTRLIVVQNVIMSCLITGAGCFLIFVLVTPALGPQPEVARSNGKTTILECTDDGCRRR